MCANTHFYHAHLVGITCKIVLKKVVHVLDKYNYRSLLEKVWEFFVSLNRNQNKWFSTYEPAFTDRTF